MRRRCDPTESGSDPTEPLPAKSDHNHQLASYDRSGQLDSHQRPHAGHPDFGVSRSQVIRDGLDAEHHWERYLRSGDESVRADLITYNTDDVDGLIAITRCFQVAAGTEGAPRPFLGPLIDSFSLLREPPATRTLTAAGVRF